MTDPWMNERKVLALEALAEQQRIANLIALADVATPHAETQTVADARAALFDFKVHEDARNGGWFEFKPDIAKALGLEASDG